MNGNTPTKVHVILDRKPVSGSVTKLMNAVDSSEKAKTESIYAQKSVFSYVCSVNIFYN